METKINPNGLTFWDFILKLFKNPRTFLVTFAILLILIVCLLLMGYLGYDNNGFHIGKSKPDSTLITKIASTCFDKDLKFCIDQAQNKKLDYVTENIFIDVDADSLNSDTLVEKIRISYTIRSLKKLENVFFTEKYQTTSNGIMKHVFGTDKEELSGKGNVYDILLNLEANETKTIMTGCDYYFTLPLADNRNEVAGDMTVNNMQDVYIYPNDEDVIKNITMRIASNSLNIRPMIKGARRYVGPSIIKDDPYLQFDQNHLTNYNSRSISYTWKNILPKERVVIYFEWK